MTLYVTGVSFEERCLALPESLSLRTGNERALLVEFLGYENVGPYLQNRARIHQVLRAKGYAPVVIEGEPSRPLEALRQIAEEIKRTTPEKVFLDISTLPRNYLFGVCRLLALYHIPTFIRYYKPQDYGTELSRGVGSVQTIAGFEGSSTSSGEVVLAIILGFEGYKALQAWERIGPTRVIALLGDPPFKPGFLDRSRQHNDELLTKLKDVHVERLHTSDVLVAKNQLQRLYQECTSGGREISFVLCPLGTKLQSLAAFAFATQNKDVSVLYVSSLRYFSENYSTGYHSEFTQVALNDLLA